MHKLVYYIIFLFWFLASLLPLRLLYLFSDLLYFPLYYGMRYRRKVVRNNLVDSFPEKKIDEIRKIEREFYRYFCDYMVETVKLFSISKRQIKRRMTFGGLEQVNETLKTTDCVVYMGHYCNWEWVISLPLNLDPSSQVLAGQIYHRLENKAFDNLFLKMRARFGGVNIEMFTALRQLVRYRQANQRFIIGFISDQSPNWGFMNMWTEFLHRKTSFFVGAENIAKMTDAAVWYMDVKRVKRGYYHAEFQLITNTPKEYASYDITVEYGKRLEQVICREPQYWLWSHNRWKRTYENYLQFKRGEL